MRRRLPRHARSTFMQVFNRRFLLPLAVGVCFAIAPAAASASQAISSFTVSPSTTRAGGHPDITTEFSLADAGEPEVAKNIVANFPEGVFGNPNAIPTCSLADLASFACPSTSQAGVVTLHANYAGNSEMLLGTAPVYDVNVQVESETARLAFVVPTLNIPISIPVQVRTGGDYGLRLTVSGITQTVALASVKMTVWGFPAAKAHDNERFLIGSPGLPSGCPGEATAFCASNFGQAPLSTHTLARPFIDNPSACSGQPLAVSLDVSTYQDPVTVSHADDQYSAVTDCNDQTFHPSLNVGLTSQQADSPSGMDIEMRAALPLGTAVTPSNIRSASIQFPEGLSINPDAADGQQACTDAEANFGTEEPAQCPDQTKIGTFEVHTPALIGPLHGALYIGEPTPGDQYRIFMIASGFGINAKIVASVHPDPQTGQLSVSIPDLPQVPFEEFDVHIFASDRGLFATPTDCGDFRVRSLLKPWNEKLAVRDAEPSFTTFEGANGRPCGEGTRPFNPRLSAGMSNPIAGAFSAFSLRLERDDGDQFLHDLSFSMPPGLTGSLRGLSYCSESAIREAANQLGRTEEMFPSCRASSLIGTTNVAAGPGSHPFHVNGKMYLAGPFKGAPLSLVAITPAVAGPYDYGTQVVRVALFVDPLDAHVTAVSDTVPSIIGGVPVRMRTIQVNIDKPEFTINPTNCSPFSVASQGVGDERGVADFSSYFHVVDCYALGFKPSMSIRQVGGKKGTTRNADPTLKFGLRTRPGDANIKSLSVTLPPAFEIDSEHLGNICSEKELAETQCAGRQQIGRATTETSLLDEPLSGPVYAVSGQGGLPRLAFILNGQVNLVPRAQSQTVKAGLRTTVPVVPDAPIDHFSLTVFGGKHGYITNTRGLCGGNPPRIIVSFQGQNGKTLTKRMPIKASC